MISVSRRRKKSCPKFHILFTDLVVLQGGRDVPQSKKNVSPFNSLDHRFDSQERQTMDVGGIKAYKN